MIYFLYGTDGFRLREKLSDLTKDFQVTRRLEDPEELIQMAGAISLFKQKTVLVMPLPDNELDVESLSKVEDTVVFYAIEPDKRKKAFKQLCQTATCFEFIPLTRTQVLAWILDRANISREAASRLEFLKGSDLEGLDNEINKLSAFTDYTREISLADIDLLVAGSIQTNIFTTVELLAKGDRSGAVRKLFEHLREGVDEQYLFNMIIYQFRTLFQIANNETKGLHPYVIKKSVPLLGRYSLTDLKKIYQQLRQLDLWSKKGVLEPSATFFALRFGL